MYFVSMVGFKLDKAIQQEMRTTNTCSTVCGTVVTLDVRGPRFRPGHQQFFNWKGSAWIAEWYHTWL